MSSLSSEELLLLNKYRLPLAACQNGRNSAIKNRICINISSMKCLKLQTIGNKNKKPTKVNDKRLLDFGEKKIALSSARNFSLWGFCTAQLRLNSE
jgi:hypothetical protein